MFFECSWASLLPPISLWSIGRDKRAPGRAISVVSRTYPPLPYKAVLPWPPSTWRWNLCGFTCLPFFSYICLTWQNHWLRANFPLVDSRYICWKEHWGFSLSPACSPGPKHHMVKSHNEMILLTSFSAPLDDPKACFCGSSYVIPSNTQQLYINTSS